MLNILILSPLMPRFDAPSHFPTVFLTVPSPLDCLNILIAYLKHLGSTYFIYDVHYLSLNVLYIEVSKYFYKNWICKVKAGKIENGRIFNFESS